MLDPKAFEPALILDPDAFATESVSERYVNRAKAAFMAHAERVTAQETKRQEKQAQGIRCPTRFSTQYAVAHAKKLGWHIEMRERFDYRLKKHFDVYGGFDLLCRTPDGPVAIQACVTGELKEHLAKMESVRSLERARAMMPTLRAVVWEFDRGCKTPTRETWIS